MKAIVCVKQVPDTSGKVAVKADGTMDRASMATITNPDDLNALEAALQLKDATGCEVVVVTMGPPPAEGMLRELLARGADKAVLVSGREFGGSDTFATSQILAAAINKIGVGPEDVVFCGRQAIDGDTAQVGPQIAEKLHLPQVTYAADIKKEGNALTVKRMLEDGYMMIKVQTPCLITCIKELNEPRYMNVPDIFTCYDKPMEVFDYNTLKDDPLIEVDTIGLKGSPRDFDSSVLSYALSKKTLNVAGPESQINKLSALSVGTIDLSTFALNKVYEMPIELPTGIHLLDNLENITVSFDSSKLETKTLNLPSSCVQVINLPASYQLTVETERLMNVTLCGPVGSLEALTPEQVVIEIDADDFSVAIGQQNIACRLYVPANGKIFALGSYVVQCKIESN